MASKSGSKVLNQIFMLAVSQNIIYNTDECTLFHIRQLAKKIIFYAVINVEYEL